MREFRVPQHTVRPSERDSSTTVANRDKMNDAVRKCLDRCYRASNPLASLAVFVETLRRSSDWSDTEISEVELTVRKLLKALIDDVRRGVEDDPIFQAAAAEEAEYEAAHESAQEIVQQASEDAARPCSARGYR